MTTRGLTPVVGIVVLLGIVVVLAGVTGTALLTVETPEPAPATSIEVEAEAATDEITVRHAGGEAIDPESITVRLAVDGSEFEEQPSVPFFSIRGFDPGPTGPFNARWDGEWTAGERASVRVSSTNSPSEIDQGAVVEVTVLVDGHVIADDAAVAR